MAAGAALLLLLAALLGLGQADEAPKVEVYSRNHGVDGEENTLNCFVSGFHPPKINISFFKNGEPMSNVKYTDMSFNDKWYFQRLAYVTFTPRKGDIYVCRVAHSAFPEPQSFRWDADF
ncbi:beta-2-microglobulin [Falco biarmicus]|uniref:beta-2-microglobulin n=1 Tax=Falco cherrug TaxID=345164 RepID=UPI0024789B90|nr:beta-2-microglobulin [Falco cherrug]XP_056200848.1 beta-2-microglobulin [Falco biarmicus]